MAAESYKALSKTLSKDTNLLELWSLHKEVHKRNYTTDEDAKRFELFTRKVGEIIEHNAKYSRGEVTFSMGLNKFADMFENEINPFIGVAIPQ